MPQNNRLQRQIGEASFQSGNTSRMELPESHYLVRLNVLVDWDVTVDSTGGSFNGNGILDLVDRLEVSFDGGSTVKNTGFAMSHFLDWYERSTRPRFDDLDLSTAEQQTGTIQTYVDFSVHPDVVTGMFPSFTTDDFNLFVHWGTESDVVTDASNITINDATLSAESVERRRPAVETSYLDRFRAFRETERFETLDHDGEHALELPQGNRYYSVAVQVLDDGSPDVDLVNGLTIEENGHNIHRSTSLKQARATDQLEYSIEELAPGFAILNYGIKGDLTDTVATRGMDQFELLVDCDGTSPTGAAGVNYAIQELVSSP